MRTFCFFMLILSLGVIPFISAMRNNSAFIVATMVTTNENEAPDGTTMENTIRTRLIQPNNNPNSNLNQVLQSQAQRQQDLHKGLLACGICGSLASGGCFCCLLTNFCSFFGGTVIGICGIGAPLGFLGGILFESLNPANGTLS